MAGPHDPDDAYWSALRRQPAFARAWNAALWEAAKAVIDAKDRREALALLRDLTLTR